MKPVRLPVAANNVEDNDTKGVAASPRLISTMFNGGRHRRWSISDDSLGCLALLDAGEQRERPRAFPSTGGILPTYVKAQPMVHVHRPRAVLSSPDNDELTGELQGQQGLKLTSFSGAPKAVLSTAEDLSEEVKLTSSSSAPKAMLTPSEDLPHVPLNSIEDLALLSSKEISSAVPSSPNDLLSLGVFDEASSCSTSSNWECIDESNELKNELLDNKANRSLSSAATKPKKINHGLSSESRLERNGNEENLSKATTVNWMAKKHSILPSNASRGPAKQHSLKPASKGNTGRVLRPWY